MSPRVLMIALPMRPHCWTEAEYLAFERASDGKHEYYDGQIYDTVGASLQHAQITANVIAALHSATLDSPCRVFTSDLRVKLHRAYVYPDVTVVCSTPQLADQDTLLNPTVIVEVLSPSTEAHDRGTKWQRYQQLESLQDYLLVTQDKPRVEHFARQGAQQWSLTICERLSASVALTALNVQVSLAAIYANVTFSKSEEAT
ncbi:MAG: Uma2 family endonuclease [Anaerolineae bacterium]|nr:Uma2 family endonuclease [Anaerolineae bacterium]